MRLPCEITNIISSTRGELRIRDYMSNNDLFSAISKEAALKILQGKFGDKCYVIFLSYKQRLAENNYDLQHFLNENLNEPAPKLEEKYRNITNKTTSLKGQKREAPKSQKYSLL